MTNIHNRLQTATITLALIVIIASLLASCAPTPEDIAFQQAFQAWELENPGEAQELRILKEAEEAAAWSRAASGITTYEKYPNNTCGGDTH